MKNQSNKSDTNRPSNYRIFGFFWLGCLAFLTGCVFLGISAEVSLQDAVTGLEEDLRWERSQSALRWVDLSYRSRFIQNRTKWGKTVRVSESEVLSIDFADKKKKAHVNLAVLWYSQDTMRLYQTTIRQEWKRVHGKFFLCSEEIA